MAAAFNRPEVARVPSFYAIRFEPEGRTEDFHETRGSYYLFPDGTRVELEAAPVWCRRCDAVREGERVEPIASIDQLIADLQDPTSLMYQFAQAADLSHLRPGSTDTASKSSPPDLLIDGARRRRRRWRTERVSPAKCLTCGSTELVPLDRQPVPHPSGTGTIAARHAGFWTGSFQTWAFTPEGDRIGPARGMDPGPAAAPPEAPAAPPG
jgi:hypothetical protein